MMPQPKKPAVMDKIQTGLISLSVSLLLIIVNMMVTLRDDVQNLKKDREWEGAQLHEVQEGLNATRVNLFDMNGRLHTVEAIMQENALPSKKK